MSTTASLPHAIGPTIYGLFIGIETYKSDRISNLDCCLADAIQLRSLLAEQLAIPEGNLVSLYNEEATRANIIATFKQHFGQLKDGDIALLYYSGHGSWERAQPDFIRADIESPGGYNELVVCYDSGDPGHYDISDKEWRYLVSSIQYPEDADPKKIQFIALMDCCHSGSMFRSGPGLEEDLRDATGALLKVKRDPGSTDARPLTAFLDNYYAKQLKETGTLQLPEANIIYLSACLPRKRAYEGPNGGYFTLALVKALRTAHFSQQSLSYAELHFLVRNETERISSNLQSPNIEFSGSMNPFLTFLSNKQVKPPTLPLVEQKEGHWVAQLGAIHGLDGNIWENKSINIYSQRDLDTPLGTAKVKKVQIEHTLLDISFPLSVEQLPIAALYASPLPIAIQHTPDAIAQAEALQKELQGKKNRTRFKVVSEAYYKVKISSGEYTVWRGDTLITGATTSDPALGQAYVMYLLNKMVRWEQVNRLTAPKNAFIDSSQVQVTFSYHAYDGSTPSYLVGADQAGESSITIPFDPNEQYNGAILYRFEITHTYSQGPLFYYLVHLDSLFGLTQLMEDYLTPNRHYSGEKKVFDSRAHKRALSLVLPNASKDIDDFILIISKEQLTYPSLFIQEPIAADAFGKMVDLSALPSNSRGGITVPFFEDDPANWSMKRIRVQLKR